MKHVCMITMHQGDLNIPPSSSFCLVLCETSCKSWQDCACAPQCQWLLKAAVVPEADPHSILPSPTTERDFLPSECGTAWKLNTSETERKGKVRQVRKRARRLHRLPAVRTHAGFLWPLVLPLLRLLVRINLMLHILSIYLSDATICSHAWEASK